MINFLSNYIVNFFVKKEFIKNEEKPIYVYGYQIILMSLLGILIISILGIILNRPIESIIFLIVFIVTRQYCGGYHAKTFHGCILSFIFSYIIVLLLLELIFEKIELHHAILMLLFYMLTILKYAPIENKSKSLTNEIKQINHKKSIIIGIIWSFLSLGLFSYTRTISLMVILTLSLITVLILIEKVRKEG